MDQERLNSLISRLEEYSRLHPTAYRLRVGLLAALGYAYLLVVVLLLLLLIYTTFTYVRLNFITIKLVWIPLAVVGGVLRALWVTIPKPEGKEIKPEEAPQLFSAVLDVQQSLDGPKVHHVLLTDDFNAGIVQVPRLGMFGWLRNYLMIGLPLLKSLNPEEFRSVLAHEFGHLSGKHGSFSGWIYRIRQSWSEILTRVHVERRYASFIFEPFLNWYATFLNAYSFVLARAQEYEADQFSAELSGKEVTARTLMRVSTKDRMFSNEFWPNFFRQANSEISPPKKPFSQMLAAAEGVVDQHKGTKWVLQELRVKTGYEDTHPALADRLAALGYGSEDFKTAAISRELAQPKEGTSSAAQAYLQVLPDEWIAGVDRLWREGITSAWTDQFKQGVDAAKRIKELNFSSSARDLSLEELWERAALIGATQGSMAAVPRLREILELNPDHAAANLALSQALLEEKNEAGIAYLDKGISLNEAAAAEACNSAYDFYLERGDFEAADRYYERGRAIDEKLQRFYEQSVSFSADDRFVTHGLHQSDVLELSNQLKGIHGLGRTYLVRKILDEELEPVYVMGAFATFTWREGQNDKHVNALIDELSTHVKFNSYLIIISLDRHRYLLKKFDEIPGSVLQEGGDENVELRH